MDFIDLRIEYNTCHKPTLQKARQLMDSLPIRAKGSAEGSDEAVLEISTIGDCTYLKPLRGTIEYKDLASIDEKEYEVSFQSGERAPYPFIKIKRTDNSVESLVLYGNV